MSQLEVDKIIPQSGTTLTIGDSGDTISFADGATLAIDTNTLAIDSTNNRVGIGTTSPSYTLQVDHQGSENATIVAKGLAPAFGLYDTTTSAYNWALYNSNGDLTFYNTLNTNGFNSLSEKMRIDSSGRVGIGTSSPDSILHLYSNNSGGTPQSRSALIIEDTESNGDSIQFLSSDTGFQSIFFGDASDNDVGRIAYSHSGDSMRFNTNGSEAMRIDSSGNVLVGKTSDAFADVGVVLSDSQANSFTRNGANVISVRRNTSDGDIVSFYKDTTKVGSIHTRSSNLSIGSVDTGLEFNQANDIIFPANPSTNNTRDNAIDLGSGGARFKNGYFAGTVTANAFSGDGSGLTNVNQPYFIAGNNTPQNLTNGVSTGINLQTEDVDSDGCFNNTGSATTLNGISVDAYSFAPNVAGYYVIGASVHFQTVADGTSLEMMIMKNQGAAIRNMIHSANSSKDVNPHCSLLIYANGSTDDFQLQVRLDGASDNTYYNSNYVRFWGFRVV